MPKRKSAKKPNGGLDDTRKFLRDKFGEGVVRIYEKPPVIQTVSTGIDDLDLVLGGGIPCGRMIELFGNPSAGKTTILLSIMAEAQNKFKDKSCVYIDVEHALDLQWAHKIGIDLKRFDHCQPEFGEDAMLVMEEYLKSDKCSIIALDSVAALTPKPEREGEFGAANIGLQARLVAQAMKRLSSHLFKHKETSLIFVNQKRANLSGPAQFTAFERAKPTGGKALPFYMTSRLEVYKIETIKNSGGIETGQKVEVRAWKHKVPPGPGGRAKFVISNKDGIDRALMLLEGQLKDGTIVRAGSWYAFPDGTKVQGEEAAKEKIQLVLK
jgi:recombination protein RecA